MENIWGRIHTLYIILQHKYKKDKKEEEGHVSKANRMTIQDPPLDNYTCTCISELSERVVVVCRQCRYAISVAIGEIKWAEDH